MKKIVFMLVLAMTCQEVSFQGSSIVRCENDEAICYIKQGIGGGISCIGKGV